MTRDPIPVTDPDLDAPDGAVVDGFRRSGDTWLPVPHRIQMTRTKPWRAEHPDAVIVDRSTRWGNPFRITVRDRERVVVDDNGIEYPTVGDTREAVTRQVVGMFRRDIERETAAITVDEIRRDLAGRDLACWCPLDSPCHADVLLAISRGENP
jgi:hypothetical protein